MICRPGLLCCLQATLSRYDDHYNDDSNNDDGVQVRNDAPPGQVLTRVEATDDDSEAGVSFSLVTEESSDRAEEYFSVSPGGDVVLMGDLTTELYDEYELTILASDSGSPSLSTRARLRVRVLQVVTLAPNTGVGFEDSSHVIQVRSE